MEARLKERVHESEMTVAKVRAEKQVGANNSVGGINQLPSTET